MVALRSSEGTKVGEQRLNSCEGEQNTAKRSPALGLISDEICPSEVGRKGFENRVIEMCKVLWKSAMGSMCQRDPAHIDTEREIESQPDNNDWSERTTNFRCPKRLDQEEKDKYCARSAHNSRFTDVRFHNFQSKIRGQPRPNTLQKLLRTLTPV